MRIIRLGFAGTGMSARFLHMPALQKLKDRYRVVSVFNRTRSKAEKFAKDFKIPKVAGSLDELANDPSVDVVVAPVPILQIVRVTEQILRSGKPCFSEKPIAPSYPLGVKHLQRVRKARGPLFITENCVFDPLWVEIARVVKTGIIGKPLYFRFNLFYKIKMEENFWKRDWRRRPRFPGGNVTDSGIHNAAQVQMVFGAPDTVHSKTALIRKDAPPMDAVYAQLEYKSGLVGHLALGYSHPANEWGTCFAVGTKGVLRADNRVLTVTVGKKKTVKKFPGTSGFGELYAHYYQVLTGRTKNRYLPKRALEDLRLIHRIIS